jgi:hypothetical protein
MNHPIEAIDPGKMIKMIMATSSTCTNQRRQEELLGRLIEQYQRRGEEMPMGLKLLGYDSMCVVYGS